MMMMMMMILIIITTTTSTAVHTSARDVPLCRSSFRSSLKILEQTHIYLLNRSLLEEATLSPISPFFLLSLSLSLSLSLCLSSYFLSLFSVYLFLYFSFSLFSSLMTLGIWWNSEINIALACMNVSSAVQQSH